MFEHSEFGSNPNAQPEPSLHLVYTACLRTGVYGHRTATFPAHRRDDGEIVIQTSDASDLFTRRNSDVARRSYDSLSPSGLLISRDIRTPNDFYNPVFATPVDATDEIIDPDTIYDLRIPNSAIMPTKIFSPTIIEHNIDDQLAGVQFLDPRYDS